jgi:hypothetical protein
MTIRNKRAVSIKRFRDIENRTLNFIAYDNVKNEPIPGMNLHFDMKKMSESLIVKAALEGCDHSIGDAGALPSGSTLKDKFEAMKARAEWLESGSEEWTSGRSDGEGSILFAAIMLAEPSRDPIKLKLFLSEQTASWKNKAMASTRYSEQVAQVRADRAKTVDEDELFADLEELDA